MNSYRFFLERGATPTVIQANSEQEARQIFDDLLLENGINSTSQDFQMLEGASHEEYAKMQNEKLPAETAKAVKQAQIESTSDLTKGMDDGGMTPIEKIGKVLGSVFAPYRTEAIASGEEPNMMTSVNDLASSMLDVATFGAGTPIKKGVKSALSWIPKALESTKGATGSGIVQTLNDVTAQENTYGKVDPIRTSIGGILGFMPAVGEAVQGAGKGIAKGSAESIFLPKQAMAKGSNPPDFGRALEEGLFSGFGKYSGLEKIKEIEAPFFARLNELKEQGIDFDLAGARKFALEEANKIKIGEAREKAIKNINNLFDAEDRRYEKYTPAITSEKEIENPFYKFMVESRLDPQDQKPTRMERVVETPAKTEVKMDLAEALPLKSEYQREANSTASKSEFGKREAFESAGRGLNRQIEATNPEARQILRDVAPYEAIKGAMKHRMTVGGSNSPLTLKDIVAFQISPFAYLGSKMFTTPKGAQKVFDATKDAKKIGKILGFKPSVATTQYGGNNE